MNNDIIIYLTNRLNIFSQNSDMHFEWYATKQMISLLNEIGIDALKESLNTAINSKGIHPVTLMFFRDTINDINKLNN